MHVYHCYLVSVIWILLLFESAVVTSQDLGGGGSSTIWSQRQIQLSNLFNFFCPRNNDQLFAIHSTFDPMNVLHLYSNPDIVRDYTSSLQRGRLVPRLKPFVKGGNPMLQMIQLFEILYFIDLSKPYGWDLFFNTTAYYSLRVNVGEYNWAMGGIYSSKFFGILTPPTFYETLPQFYTSKHEIRTINNFSEPLPPESGHIEIYDEPTYWIQDPALGAFHNWWHNDNENVFDNKKFGLVFDRKGELFLYAHHQIMSRYLAERRSSGLGDIEPLSLSNDFRIVKGFEAYFLDVNLIDFPIRGPNTALWTQPRFDTTRLYETRVLEAIDSGYAIDRFGQRVPLHKNPETYDSDIEGTNALGALVESSTSSVNLGYYGNLHGNLHENIANIRDPRYPQEVHTPGVQDHQEMNMADPVFYQIHLYIDNLYRRHKYSSPQIRTEQELQYPGISLYSVSVVESTGGSSWVGNTWPEKKISSTKTTTNDTNIKAWPISSPFILTTFFEEYNYDITNVVTNCANLEGGKTYKTTRTRLNHHEFFYKFGIFSYRFQPENAIVRIFMAPLLGAINGHPLPSDDLHWRMFELDKFPIVLSPGLNTIQRSSKQSNVLVRQGKLKRACGWPPHLLIPKGTEDGLLMKIFIIVTPALSRRGVAFTVENEQYYPAFLICGHPYLTLPDDKPMGWPFDKKINFDFPFQVGQSIRNYGYSDVIIKHVKK